MKKLFMLLSCIFSFSAFAGYPGNKPFIEGEALLDKQKTENLIVLDTRSADEYAEGHVPGAINIAYDEIRQKAPALLTDKQQTIVVYCRSGYRASKAEAALEDLGYKNLLHLKGDMLGWKSKQLPLEASPTQ